MANDTIDDIYRSEATYIDWESEYVYMDEEDIEYVDDYDGNVYYNYVGFDDPFDFEKITLGSPANLCFSIFATDVAKFTIWTLVPGKGNSYTQKSLQSVTLKYDAYSEVFLATTKPLLLDSGTYYISMESTNAKKGGEAYYNVEVNQNQSMFFEDVEDDNNWTDMKTRGPLSEHYYDVETISSSEDLFVDDWVGFGDPIDYYKFSLSGAANISFDVSATDAAKFTIYTLNGSKGNYSLKSLQATTLSKRSQPIYDDDEDYWDDEEVFHSYAATTKSILLERGTYYFSMESTNAKKGGSAGYYVSVNDNSAFFEDVSDDNDWTDMKTRGPLSEQYDVIGDYLYEGSYIDGWVGFGDPIDYYSFSLAGAANVSFDVNATDAAKFTIYTLNGSKGNYSLKSLQSTTLSKRSQPIYYDEEDYWDEDEIYYNYGATTKSILLEKGTYYISVESTNAKKGGSAGYNAYINENNSTFFEDVSDDNDWTDMKTRGPQSEQYDIIEESLYEESYIDGWVGFGDPIDYYRFTLSGTAKLSFYVGATDAAKFTIYTLTGSKGNYSLKSLQSTSLGKVSRPDYYDDEDEYYDWDDEYYYNYGASTKSLLLEKGNYYFSVESTNAKKGGSADYYVSVNGAESAFFDDVSDDNNWTDMKVNGSRSEQYDILEESLYEDLYVEDWVGFGDTIDYYGFSLDGPAKLSFYIGATDAAKFSIYTLNGSRGNYSLKSLQSTSLGKISRPNYYDDEDEYWDEDDYNYNYGASTKSLLLERGTYYFSVESTNAKQGGSASYYVCINGAESAFFDDVQDSNNWADMKTKGSRSEQYDDIESISYENDLIAEGWVGFGDPIDYCSFSLYSPAKLSFEISAMDAAKFTIYTLTGNKGSYSLKSLQSTTLGKLSQPAYYDDEDEYWDDEYYYNYGATTKSLLLESGTYYFSVESTNAKQGGNASYEVCVNQRDSFFFEDVYDENNWNRLVKSGPDGDVDYLEDFGYDTEYYGWVGFGDPVDYALFRIYDNGTQTAAVLSFNIMATDNVKVTIYSLSQKLTATGRTYSLKSLQSTTTKSLSTPIYYDEFDEVPYSFGATTKSLTIKEGGYYAISVQSTNAAKGGNASYSIEINEDFTDFFEYYYDEAALPDVGQDMCALTEPDDLQDALSAGSVVSAQDEPLSSVVAVLDPASGSLFGDSASGMLAAL